MECIPIILLVSERSGSNLLRSLLGNHHNICAPVAPHLMAEFYNIRQYYGDLKQRGNAKMIFGDMVALANHPYHDWQLEIELDSVIENGLVSSVVSSFYTVYKLKAQQENKLHFCSKGIHSFDFIDPFRAELENVKFIHLVRDPRDHVASWMKRPINLLTPYDAIIKWKSEQAEFIDAFNTRGLQCLSIRYEDLVENTSKIMASVLEYLDVEVDQNCFQTDTTQKSLDWNPYWQNLSKPVIKDNTQKFKKELLDEDILLIETIAKNEMEFFGYAPISSGNWVPSVSFYQNLERQRKAKKESIKPRENMHKLDDKLKLMQEIRDVRRKQWGKEDLMGKHIHQECDTSGSHFFRNRLKHLSYAFLGSRLTQKISNNI